MIRFQMTSFGGTVIKHLPALKTEIEKLLSE
jgi:hypothetical protein